MVGVSRIKVMGMLFVLLNKGVNYRFPSHLRCLGWKVTIFARASDISRKKKQNFAGFSGANSRKNWPISRDFRGKKVKIR